MKDLYISPEPPRYFIRDSDKNIVGSCTGYSTYIKASAARNFLINAKGALIARYKNYDHAMNKHLDSI